MMIFKNFSSTALQCSIIIKFFILLVKFKIYFFKPKIVNSYSRNRKQISFPKLLIKMEILYFTSGWQSQHIHSLVFSTELFDAKGKTT